MKEKQSLSRTAESVFFGIEESAKVQGKSEPVPAGTHIARCYSLIDLGTQTWTSPQFGVQSKRKIRITWELPNEKRVFNEEKGEQPLVIAKEFTLSAHEKSNLRKSLESWRGKGFTKEELQTFDEKTIVGIPCILNVIHNEKGYADIASIAPLMKGTECPEQCNPSVIFSLNGKLNEELFNSLPEFIRQKIEVSPEYQAKLKPPIDKHEVPENLPF